jgi:hypothetical protein
MMLHTYHVLVASCRQSLTDHFLSWRTMQQSQAPAVGSRPFSKRGFAAVLLVATLLSGTAEAASCGGGQPCAAGQKCLADSSCQPCPPGTYQANTSHAYASCLDCPLGYTCRSWGTKGFDSTTVPGYAVPPQLVPYPCLRGTYDNQGGVGTSATVDGECKSCASGRRSAGDVEYKYSSSSSTRTGGATECVDCAAGRAGDGKSDTCSECTASSGKYQPSSGKSSCMSCGEGMKRVAGLDATATTGEVCLPCAPGRFQPVKTKQAGSNNWLYNGQPSSVWPCVSGCKSPRRYPHVDTGTPGYSRASCYTCPEGRWSSVSSATTCSRCAQGKFFAGSGATSGDVCTSDACRQGFWCDNARGFIILNIGGWKWTSSGLPPTSIKPRMTACAQGRYGDRSGLSAASDCLGCSAGKYSDDASYDEDPDFNESTDAFISDTQCTKCFHGKFSASTARKTACDGECPMGRFGAQFGMSSSAECDGNCSAGKWSDQLSFYEDVQCGGRCAVGRFSPDTGFTSGSLCPLCTPGFFTDNEGNTVCEDCAIGRYINTSGTTSCVSCHRGEYMSEQGASVCFKCERGMFSATRNMRVECKNCFGGRWSNFTGASALSECARLQCRTFPPQPRTLIAYENNRTLPSRVLLTFEHGYEGSYQANILCVWSGLPPEIVYWSGLDLQGRLPVAIGVQCDVFSSPNNGRVNFTNDRRFPSRARFRCEKGFVLSVDDVLLDVSFLDIECTRDRVWNASAPQCERAPCPQLKGILQASNVSKALVLVTPPDGDVPTNWDGANMTADWAYTDRAIFSCDVLGIVPMPYKLSVCTASGTWDPDPSSVVCAAMPCQNLESVPGKDLMPAAMKLWVDFEGARTEHKVWIPLAATSVIDFECAPHAMLYVKNNFSQDRCRACNADGPPLPDGAWQQTVAEGTDVCCSVRTKCTPTQPSGDSKYGPIRTIAFPTTNPDVPEDSAYRDMECRCEQGWINVEDTRRANCVACEVRHARATPRPPTSPYCATHSSPDSVPFSRTLSRVLSRVLLTRLLVRGATRRMARMRLCCTAFGESSVARVREKAFRAGMGSL